MWELRRQGGWRHERKQQRIRSANLESPRMRKTAQRVTEQAEEKRFEGCLDLERQEDLEKQLGADLQKKKSLDFAPRNLPEWAELGPGTKAGS